MAGNDLEARLHWNLALQKTEQKLSLKRKQQNVANKNKQKSSTWTNFRSGQNFFLSTFVHFFHDGMKSNCPFFLPLKRFFPFYAFDQKRKRSVEGSQELVLFSNWPTKVLKF